MDFSLTEAQQELAALARRILTDRVTPTRLREIAADPDHIDKALLAELANAGILGAALPQTVGGGGFDLLEQCSVLIEIGRAVAPVPFLASIVMAASAIARFGSSEQWTRWGVPAMAGRVVLTAALSEEDGEDPSRPSTHAERITGGWLLTGAKTTVPAGMAAELVLVPATTPWGVAVFLITPANKGVTLNRQRVVDDDSVASLHLDKVHLDDSRMLGPADNGAAVVDWLAARGTVGLCATQLGVTERALEMTAEYATTRRQFDRPIGSFQAVAQRLADAYIDVGAMRLTLWQAAWRLSAGLSCDTEIAIAKFWAADGGHRVAHTAVHIHGGVGIDVDYPLHRYFIAAKRNEFSLGAATTQLRRIGAVLAAEPA